MSDETITVDVDDGKFEISKEDVEKWLEEAHYCLHHINKIEDICNFHMLDHEVTEETDYNIIIEELEYLLHHGKELMDCITLSNMHEVISGVYRCKNYCIHNNKYTSLGNHNINMLIDCIKVVVEKLGYDMYMENKNCNDECSKVVFIFKKSWDKFIFE